jgi:CheY-like chemotaxis protein
MSLSIAQILLKCILVAATGVILVVEDREDDILLLRKALSLASIKNPLHFVRTGEEAVAYFSGEGKYSSRDEFPLPLLTLLDLKLPGINGFEVLTWIRRQDGLRGLPVVVLTSSDQLCDVNRAYELGANSFFVKEFDFNDFVNLTKLLERYWLKTVKTPESSRQISRPDSD